MKHVQTNSRKLTLFSILGVFALATSFITPAAFAAEETSDANVQVVVEPYITIDVSTGTTAEGQKVVDVKDTEGNPRLKTGNFAATVISNKGYNLFISTPDNIITASLVDSASNREIKTITADTDILRNTGWGIKCVSADYTSENCNSNYRGIPLFKDLDFTNSIPFYSYGSGTAKNTTNFEVGVYAGDEVASGTYTTNILITAAQI